MPSIEIKELTVGINVSSFEALFTSKKSILNEKGHPKAYEMTLVPRMQGEILDELKNEDCYLVQFPFYTTPIYVFKKHVQVAKSQMDLNRPTKEILISNLKSCVGRAYLWGGNHVGKTQFFIDHFKKNQMTIREKRALELDGIDCSGLLFYASNFSTPRNTKELQLFGSSINDLGVLHPLDLILTKGHVAIILDENYVIQSRQNRGVYISALKAELKQLLNKKNFKSYVHDENDFSIRRFY